MFFILYSLSIINTCTPGNGAPTGANLLCLRSHAFETSNNKFYNFFFLKTLHFTTLRAIVYVTSLPNDKCSNK